MAEVASRELRNETASLLRTVQNGEDVTVTVNGRPVARLVPFEPSRRRRLSRDELVSRIGRAHADSRLLHALSVLAGETTDDPEPLR